jgi:hypothetical protein
VFIVFHCYILVSFIVQYFISFQGLEHFDEILQEADGIIISRGDLGIDLPPERVNFGLSQNT